MTIYLKNANGSVESFYLDRLRRYFENAPENYGIPIGEDSKHYSHWVGYTDKHYMHQTWVERLEFFEEEYKGFQIVVLAQFMKYQRALDVMGNLMQPTGFDEDKVAEHDEALDHVEYLAYAYEIGSDFDRISDLNHSWHFSVFNRCGVANSLEKTFQKARKRLEIRALIKPLRAEISALANDHCLRTNAVNPYNAVIGDEVFVGAFGRLRKGIIVATTGSKFVVAYMTPSNRHDLKWKTLPLSGLFVEK